MKFGRMALFPAALVALFAATPETPSAALKKTSPKKTARSSPNRTRKGKSSGRAASRQQTPTPQRYKEIQQALASKGYLKSVPNGIWDADSTEALRQFQTDQKLTPSGKINASSLIGLGLGPKTASSVPPPPKP